MNIYTSLRRLFFCGAILTSLGIAEDCFAQKDDLKIVHQNVLNDAINFPKTTIDYDQTIKLLKKDGQIKGYNSDAKALKSVILPLVQHWYHYPSDVSKKEQKRISNTIGYWADHHIISANWTSRAFGEPRICSVVGMLIEKIDADGQKNNLSKMAMIAEGSFGSFIHADAFQGANIGYRLDGMFGYATMSRDPQALDIMQDNMSFSTEAHNELVGLQSDYSWWQHNGGTGQNYWVGYGTSWLDDILNYGRRTKETKWALSTHALNQIQDAILNGLSYHYYRNFTDYHVLGRHTTKKGSSNQPDQLVQMIKRLQAIGEDKLERSEELNALVEQLSASTYPFSAKYFYNSDLMIYRENRYFTSLKMRSDRSTGPESGNMNGKRNYHFGDGTFFIVKDGGEYNDVKVGLNYQHLPGTTSENRSQNDIPLVDWGRRNKNLNVYAGGLVDGYQAISAFQQEREDSFSNITANKGYFYEKDQILFAGNSIRKKQSSSRMVLTNINQATWKSDILFYVNGTKGKIKKGEYTHKKFEITKASWFLQDGIGYLITPIKGEAVTIILDAEQRTADWWDLDQVYKKGDVETVDIFSLSIDNTKSDHYNYTIFPTIVPLDMMAQVTETSLALVANNDTVQAVYSSHRNQAQLVFYKAGTVKLPSGLELTVSNPVIMTCRETEAGIQVVATDPLQSQSDVNITVNRKMARSLFALPAKKDGLYHLEMTLNVGDWSGKQSSRFYAFEKQVVPATPKLIYSNMLNDKSNWVVEQYKGESVTIGNGEMEIIDQKGCTIWFKKELEGNIAIEYDATVISNGGKYDRVSDLNCFWMAQDPRQTTDFFSYRT
ncbi:polysaccharide lyase family 8 super-sandwich domain-containing protein [Prolixibacteraceae bacterium]|nr:polysaccharide lyase family 8 super-sandwich domain-containing protein [Prolixibacteraceae bacterium]